VIGTLGASLATALVIVAIEHRSLARTGKDEV